MQEIAILGAGGLTGKELLKILHRHNYLLPIHITSNQYAGKKVKEVFPDLELSKIADLEFRKHEDPIPDKIPVILATPNFDSMSLVYRFYEKEKRMVIDLSGAYRLNDLSLFKSFYGFEHLYPKIIQDKVYGLTEVYRDAIKNAKLISNPGCYPTSILIPLYYFKEYLSYAKYIIVDSKSGVSGAGGRVEDAGFSFMNVYENFKAYKILKHQHEPEIQQYLNEFIGKKIDLTFTPHLLPIYRGILSTIVIIWEDSFEFNDKMIYDTISNTVQKETFVRLYQNPESIELKNVQNTNYCDFSFRTRNKITVIISAIDNLQKGAAGQAIQNLNLMLNFKEEESLL